MMSGSFNKIHHSVATVLLNDMIHVKKNVSKLNMADDRLA